MSDSVLENKPEDKTITMSPSAWLDAAYKLGVTAVIAIGLVWVLTQDVKSGLVEMRVAHAAMQVEMMKTTTINETILVKMISIERVLLAMCINAATTKTAQASCVQ